MQTFITINENFVVKEVVTAITAVGFLTAPREDIKIGDTLTDYEKMLLSLIPWDDNLVPAEPVAPDPDPRITASIDAPADSSST